MLSLLITGVAANAACTGKLPDGKTDRVGCGLPANIDTGCDCVLTTASGTGVYAAEINEKYGSVDVAGNAKVVLTISEMVKDTTVTDAATAKKCPGACDKDKTPDGPDGTGTCLGACDANKEIGHADHDDVYHYKTQGTLQTYDATNDRYILSCAQPTGHKTLKVTVKRPNADDDHWSHPTGAMNYFGAEWVKLYQKDSWIEEKSEKEPYMHNDHGSIIPLSNLRGTDPTWAPEDLLSDDKATATEKFSQLHVYMNVDKAGDYEFKYGNPNLRHVNDSSWSDDANETACKGFNAAGVAQD